jgi:hypothetical protein
MPLATHTGILASVQSTCPPGHASARTQCSSTTRGCELRLLCFPLWLSGNPLRPHHPLASERLPPLTRKNPRLQQSLPSQKNRVHNRESDASVTCFSPGHLRRTTTRPVSYYALFQWMAASKPTSWLSVQLHILSHLTRTSGP